MQRIRNVDPRWDNERILDLFEKAQVSTGTNRKRGFYEYHLTEQEMQRKISACPELSLVLEDNRGQFLAYLLSYPLDRIDTHGLNAVHEDPVLKKLARASPKVVYADQLCIAQDIPIFVGGRVADVWTNMIYGEKLNGSVCAIPSKPWENIASRRLTLARGYSRVGHVTEGELTLDIFAKPHWQKGISFDPHENFLGINFN